MSVKKQHWYLLDSSSLARVNAGLWRMGQKYVEFEQWDSQQVVANQLLFVVMRKPVVKFSKPKEVQLSGKGIGFYCGYLRRQKHCPVSQKLLPVYPH